jgi:hypothetical protein
MLGSAAFTTRLALFTLYMNVLLLMNLLRLPFPPFEVSSFEWVAFLVQRMVSARTHASWHRFHTLATARENIFCYLPVTSGNISVTGPKSVVSYVGCPRLFTGKRPATVCVTYPFHA